MADDETSNNGRIDRRKFLGGLGTGVAAGMAGCGGNGTPTEGPGGTEETETTPTKTDTPGSKTGGKPVIGMAVPPKSLNPLVAGTVYSSLVLDRQLLYGTATHPDDQSFNAWAFTDWEVMPENVGSSKPTVNATLRDDLTFSDGEKVTPEDFKFSQNYFVEQSPITGSLNANAQKKIEDITIDGNTVSIFLKKKDQRWFTNILGYPILPKHIWKDVANHKKFTARKEKGGLVGAGAFTIEDFNWENWFELKARDDFPIPAADYVDWIGDEGPYVDGIRFEIFGSQNAMEQAVLNGDIDTGFVAGGFTISNAVKAQGKENLTVRQAQDSGFNHLSYNLRRVPFDDMEFRQFLNAMMDTTWIVETPYRGIGAVAGDYPSIPALGQWRPPAPDEAEEHEGIPLPDLDFPGSAGTFNLNQKQINKARQMLVDNPDTKHDYSFQTRENGSQLITSPDGKELFVNGKPLTEAHTDNDGNAGQGPLVHSFQPPQEDLYQARTHQRYVGALKKVGIPVEAKVKTINAQIPTVYGKEDFDMFAMGWAVGVNMTFFAALYSSQGADLKDETDSPAYFNPMGYTGADDLIFKDLKLMDFEERIPVVKKINATIWNEAPTRVTEVSNLLEPTSDDWEGWVTTLGGTVYNGSTYLNVRPS